VVSPIDAFVDACRDARPEVARAMRPEELDGIVRTAAGAVEGMRVDPVAFAAALGRAVARGLALHEVDVGEVAIAVGCESGDADALALFERRYVQPLRGLLAHMRLDDPVLAEVLQTTRRRLLVTRDAEPARLAGYAGAGHLGSLVRVVATRAALDARRDAGRKREVGLTGLTDVLIASADPERIAGSTRKREVFRAAFEATVAGLPASVRTLLRLYAVDGVGLDGLAAACGVHRSTAARRLAAAREQIRLGVRAELVRRGVAAGEVDSVIAVIDSGVELTLSRILAEPEETTGRDRDV
jgi:RNA polymerase sigma-70 factor (ECF subfamily)